MLTICGFFFQERGTQKHKLGKFGKLAKRYGKFNEHIKQSLDEMHAKVRAAHSDWPVHQLTH